MPSFGESPQGPLNALFPKGQRAAFGVHQLRAIGSGLFGITSPARQAFQSGASTGLVVATGPGSGGVPEVTATLTSTGIYRIAFPPTRSVDISAQVYSSSGSRFAAAINNLGSTSGTAQLEITRLSPTGGTAQPSGQGFLPTGSTVALSFFAAPASDGIVTY
jgi:hypothetical protein